MDEKNLEELKNKVHNFIQSELNTYNGQQN
jgi:hypothetical protein